MSTFEDFLLQQEAQDAYREFFNDLLKSDREIFHYVVEPKQRSTPQTLQRAIRRASHEFDRRILGSRRYRSPEIWGERTFILGSIEKIQEARHDAAKLHAHLIVRFPEKELIRPDLGFLPLEELFRWILMQQNSNLLVYFKPLRAADDQKRGSSYIQKEWFRPEAFDEYFILPPAR